MILDIVIPLSLHYTERGYQERAAAGRDQGHGASSGTAAG